MSLSVRMAARFFIHSVYGLRVLRVYNSFRMFSPFRMFSQPPDHDFVCEKARNNENDENLGYALRACEGGTSKDTKDTKGERGCAARRTDEQSRRRAKLV